MDRITLEEVFEDGSAVDSAFNFVAQRFNGTPCWECKGNKTVAMIVGGTVAASCEGCGGSTRIGPLLKLWTPGQPQSPARGRERPVLRAAADRVPARRQGL